jgi:two-component system sensor histidine kinase/response regulator
LAAGNRATAERSAHTLKGLAGTLGAGELQQRAARLEQALEQETGECDEALRATEEELTRLVAALRAVLPEERENISEPAAEVDWTRAREIVAKLEALLEAVDAGAIDLFEQEAALLRPALGPGAGPVRQALQDWNLVAALEALHQARQAIPSLS